MVGRVGTMARGCRTPVIADADTGYGGLLNVRHTVMGYEAAGVSGIQLEDQEMPKKCGHTPGRRVIPAEEMVLKIKVAAEARQRPELPDRRPHRCPHHARPGTHTHRSSLKSVAKCRADLRAGLKACTTSEITSDFALRTPVFHCRFTLTPVKCRHTHNFFSGGFSTSLLVRLALWLDRDSSPGGEARGNGWAVPRESPDGCPFCCWCACWPPVAKRELPSRPLRSRPCSPRALCLEAGSV